MYANTSWGLLSLAVTFGLAMLGLPAPYEFLAPWFMGAAIIFGIASVVCFAWPLHKKENRVKCASLCQHPLRAIRLINPLYIVGIGLVIALVGVALAIARGPAGNPAADKSAGALSIPLPANALDRKLSTEEILQIALAVPTHPHDVPEKLTVIDKKISPLIRSEGVIELHIRKSNQFKNNWKKAINEDRPAFLEALSGHRQELGSIFQTLYEIRKANSHFEDIDILLDIERSHYQINSLYARGFEEFIGTISHFGNPPYSLGMDYFMDRGVLQNFSSGIADFGAWRLGTEKSLTDVRKRLASIT
jgi:hypothetical protein